MKSSFATCAALVFLFAAASCAPARSGVQHACADARTKSLELLHTVRAITELNGSKDEADVSSSLVWMEAKDRCDPSSLREKPAQCIEKILSVLMNYSAEVELLAGSQSCSEFAQKLKPVMEKLLENMSMCVKTNRGKDHMKKFHVSRELAHWNEAPLCHYTMNRLYSFSILTARVFAVGDPAQHGSSQSTVCSTVG